MLHKLDKFHNSRPGYLMFGLFGLVIAYIFVGVSIDSGNWFDYLITLLAMIVFLQNLSKLIGSFFRGKRQGRAAR